MKVNPFISHVIALKETTKDQRILEMRGDFWGEQGLAKSEDYLDAVDVLILMGYRVEFRYDECLNDAVTVIRW